MGASFQGYMMVYDDDDIQNVHLSCHDIADVDGDDVDGDDIDIDIDVLMIYYFPFHIWSCLVVKWMVV
jgi:hypothetical protein